jgi:hypothetical protein
MVRDREDVEAAAAVEVAELPQAERAVTPCRVCVELAEERAGLGLHPLP